MATQTQIAARASHVGADPVLTDSGDITGDHDRLRRRYEYHKAGHNIYKQRHQQSRRLALVFGVVSVVLTVLLISLVIARSQLAGENRELERIVDSLNFRLTEAEGRRADPVPAGLLRIDYDKLVPLDNPYVKAIQLSSPTYTGGAIRVQLLVERQPGFHGATIETFDANGIFVADLALDSDLADTVKVGNAHSISGALYGLDARPSFFRVTTH